MFRCLNFNIGKQFVEICLFLCGKVFKRCEDPVLNPIQQKPWSRIHIILVWIRSIDKFIQIFPTVVYQPSLQSFSQLFYYSSLLDLCFYIIIVLFKLLIFLSELFFKCILCDGCNKINVENLNLNDPRFIGRRLFHIIINYCGPNYKYLFNLHLVMMHFLRKRYM